MSAKAQNVVRLREPSAHFHPFGVFNCASEIVALGHWAPDQTITSKELEEMIREADPKVRINIERVAGVRERRVLPDNLTLEESCVKACEAAFAKTHVTPEMIDLVIFTSVSKNYLEPATATILCHRLGIKEAKAFDVSNACLGFVDGWLIADAMIQAGRSRLCLIVGAEVGSSVWKSALTAIKSRSADPTPLLASFTLGDGAAAMIMGTRLHDRANMSMRAGIRESFGEYSDLCVIPAGGWQMQTNAASLFAAAQKHGPHLTQQLLTHLQWAPLQVDVVIPHQASLKAVYRGAVSLKIPMEKALITLDRFGNMASVSVPFTFSEAVASGKLLPGQKLLVMGYGSGLGVGIIGIEIHHDASKKNPSSQWNKK